MKILLEKLNLLRRNRYIFWAAMLKLLVSAVGLAIILFSTTAAEAAFDLDKNITQVKTAGSPNIYYLDHKRKVKKLYNNEKAFLSYGNKWSKVKTIYAWDLKQWPDAHLIQVPGDRAVYYINSGKKTLIKNEDDFNSFGFKSSDIIMVSKTDLNSYSNVDYKQAGLIFYIANNSNLAGGGNNLILDNNYPAPAVFVYNNKEVKEKRFVKGQKDIKLASFILEVPAGKEINISKINLTNNSGIINAVNNYNGFSNLRAYINYGRSQNTIAKPGDTNYSFENFDARIYGGNRVVVDVYGDTNTNLKISQAQLKLSSIAIKDINTNQEIILSRINAVSEKIYFGQTNAELNILGGGKLISNSKNNRVATFSIKNTGDEPIVLENIIVATNGEGFSKSIGYNNLAILSKKEYRIGNVEEPVAGANKLHFYNYLMQPGQENIFEIIVDSKDTPKDSFFLNLEKLEARGVKTNRKITIKGDPTEKVIVSNTNNAYVYNKNLVNSNNLSWPTNGRTINYYFKDPIYPYRNISEHNAIDIETGQGSSVRAAADGYVEVAEKTNSSSYSYITIRHDNGIKTRYGHLSQIKINVGDFVKRDQVIALSGGQPGSIGSGSYSTGPHLHFEVLVNGVNVDPLKYLE
ncbi:MAG: Peptidase, M23 family [Parcubacteria group bacterium GW2011_GWE2_39_37]|uniref:Peptidase, M23 family n=1 Tax=Candidatus Falkowbacteria bacterium GW2011_GWF2_39_8 TaxID=1618642 RepID=A0A0G0PZR3_9BACT|nr:MAG: Peptidase, M23 family [Parcubacteria group bacterium GW2011_GWE2_39_37]KKR33408.1 MAG: Peptidase, M23 family [Candidatus Falkowbacteria bacterium GW2011_GWF2_39_8]